MGKTVVVVGPDAHLGGLSSGGLGLHRHGEQGRDRRPGPRVLSPRLEALPAACRVEMAEARGVRQQGTGHAGHRRRRSGRCGSSSRTWRSGCSRISSESTRFRSIATSGSTARRASPRTGARITSITMLSGRTYAGRMFIDATYEGDLMAAAGVDYHVGREAQATYGETWNGVQTGVLHHRHHFGVLKQRISPYVDSGRPVERRAAADQHGSAGGVRRGRQTHSGLLLPVLRDGPSGQPHPVPEARGIRPEAVRAAAPHLRGWLARDVRQVRPDPQPQDRHQQPRALQHRQHRLQLRLSGGLLRAPPRDREGARDVPEGLAVLHRQRSARAEGRAGRDAALGPAARTSSPTTAAGRTRSTFARRAAWSGRSS